MQTGPETRLNLQSQVAFVKIAVTDLESTADFYTRLMGMNEVMRRSQPDGLQELVLAYEVPARNNTAVGLIAVLYPPGYQEPENDGQLHHPFSPAVIATSDPAALARRARARGYATRLGSGSTIIRDPAGNHIELITRADLPHLITQPADNRIIFPKLVVADDAAAVEFYGNLLGMQETDSSRYLHKQGVRELVFSYDPIPIDFVKPHTGIITVRYPWDFKDVFAEAERFIKPNFVIDVQDKEGLARTIQEAGFRRSAGTPINIMDPSGNIIELVNLRSYSFAPNQS